MCAVSFHDTSFLYRTEPILHSRQALVYVCTGSWCDDQQESRDGMRGKSLTQLIAAGTFGKYGLVSVAHLLETVFS